jgi:hypothetical protein
VLSKPFLINATPDSADRPRPTAAATEKRIAAVYRSPKKAGNRGTYLSELMMRANDELPDELQIRSLSHLHFLLFGWPKKPKQALVGGYLRSVIKLVPRMPKNVMFVRLKEGVRKGDLK